MNVPSDAYFTDDSMVRRVHREFVVGLAGPRTLLLQATHPVAFAGFFAHTGALDEPYERLARTAQVMDAITFGPRAAADRLTRRVRAMHRRVRGELSEPAGNFPAGTPYAADDPELLLWILAAIVDSSLLVYAKYVRRLSPEERDAYWQDYKVIGRQFGLTDAQMPDTIEDFDAYMRGMLESGDLLHHAAGPRAGDRDRHAPARAAEGPPAARARQPDHRRPAAGRDPPRLRPLVGSRALRRAARRGGVREARGRAAAAGAAARDAAGAAGRRVAAPDRHDVSRPSG